MFAFIKYLFIVALIALGISILTAIFVVGCTDERSKKTSQEIYELAYASNACMAMQIHVEKYEESPRTYTWRYLGWSTSDQVNSMIDGAAKRMIEKSRYAFSLPYNYKPIPETYSLENISSHCKTTYQKFMAIPFQ
jgi:hypothetical protein